MKPIPPILPRPARAPAEAAGAGRGRYHHGDLAEALIAAARDLVEREGPARLTLSACCRAAGVSTAAPYKHFSGKEDVLRRVVMAGFRELTEETAAARDAHPGPAAPRIAAMGRAYVRFARRSPGVFRLMFGMAGEAHGGAHPELDEAGRACFDVLIAEVARAIGGRAEDEAARGLSVMLWTFVHGVASLDTDGAYEAETAADVDAMIEAATLRLLPQLDETGGS